MSMLGACLAGMGGGAEIPMPAQHPDVIGLYMADAEAVSLNAGPDPDRVSSWRRYTGAGLDVAHALEQATEAQQPEWEASIAGIGGRPGIVWSSSRPSRLVAAGDPSIWAPLHDGTGGTLAALIRTDDTSGTECIATTYTDAAGPGVLLLAQNNAIRCIIVDETRSIILDASSAGVFTEGEWAIVVYRFDVAATPDMDLRVDRAQVKAANAGTPSGDAPATSLHVGARNDLAVPLDGTVAAMCAWSSRLSDADVATYWEDWIAAEYGV